MQIDSIIHIDRINVTRLSLMPSTLALSISVSMIRQTSLARAFEALDLDAMCGGVGKRGMAWGGVGCVGLGVVRYGRVRRVWCGPVVLCRTSRDAVVRCDGMR